MGKYAERNRLPPHAIAEGDPPAVAAIKDEHQMFRALFDLTEASHVLGEETMHHVDEEDRELLPKARAAWEQGKVDLVLIGQQIHDRRRELYEELDSMGADATQLDVEPAGDALDEIPSPATPLPMSGDAR